MASKIYTIESLVRTRLEEPTPRFWSSSELTQIIIAGIKDLWRDVVMLKQEHFLTIDEGVTLAASTSTMSSIPTDLFKVYMIEPLDGSADSSNVGLAFKPLDYNHPKFVAARTMDAIDPSNATIYYAVTSAGSPVAAPTIRVAPQVNAAVSIRLTYIPTISSSLASSDDVPIPGDCDNALVAWTVAYARAKERDDRAPDPAWLQTYAGEKARLLNSLGVRQLQEPAFVDAIFEEQW